MAALDAVDPGAIEEVALVAGDPVYETVHEYSEKILTHLMRLTRNRKNIAFAELVFKQDASGQVFFAYCTK